MVSGDAGGGEEGGAATVAPLALPAPSAVAPEDVSAAGDALAGSLLGGGGGGGGAAGRTATSFMT